MKVLTTAVVALLLTGCVDTKLDEVLAGEVGAALGAAGEGKGGRCAVARVRKDGDNITVVAMKLPTNSQRCKDAWKEARLPITPSQE